MPGTRLTCVQSVRALRRRRTVSPAASRREEADPAAHGGARGTHATFLLSGSVLPGQKSSPVPPLGTLVAPGGHDPTLRAAG